MKTLEKRRDRRIGFLLGLASAVIVTAIGVPATVLATHWSNQLEVESPDKPSCEVASNGSPVQGREYVEVLLRHGKDDCFGPTLSDISPGEEFQMRVMYVNYSDEQQDGVTLRAALPEGFNYVPGSTEIANSTSDGKYAAGIDGITDTGINVGSYSKSGNLYVRFVVRMNPTYVVPCGFTPWAVAGDIESSPENEHDPSVAGIVSIKNC